LLLFCGFTDLTLKIQVHQHQECSLFKNDKVIMTSYSLPSHLFLKREPVSAQAGDAFVEFISTNKASLKNKLQDRSFRYLSHLHIMRVLIISILLVYFHLEGICQPVSSSVLPTNFQRAKTVPSWVEQGIIYQIQPRAFTPEGTLKAATAKLREVKEVGVSIVYVCPVFVADSDTNRGHWSRRQIASGMNNPKNPYRIRDYFHVDPEYGTDNDLRAFIEESHRLGLRVLLDMVYLHCGPTAVFINDHPDFIKRDKSGHSVNASWNFPALNFDNPELREYLWKNMEYWVKEFDADGFRCDVADGIPLEFWETARERLGKIRPDIGMLSEGERVTDQVKAFDINYSFTWFNQVRSVFEGKKTAADLKKTWDEMTGARPAGARFIRYIDNHDIANDAWYNRIERSWGFSGVNAALLMNFTLDGVPFLYNGQEIADTARHTIFGKMPVNWEGANSLAGKMRLDFCRSLCSLRKSEAALTGGDFQWIDTDQPRAVMAYLRTSGNEKVLTIINLSNRPLTVNIRKSGLLQRLNFKPLLSDKATGDIYHSLEFQEYGYWVGKSIPE
jgi:glycosidase